MYDNLIELIKNTAEQNSVGEEGVVLSLDGDIGWYDYPDITDSGIFHLGK